MLSNLWMTFIVRSSSMCFNEVIGPPASILPSGSIHNL